MKRSTLKRGEVENNGINNSDREKKGRNRQRKYFDKRRKRIDNGTK